MKFLEKLAGQILESRADNLENLTVVLPNIRAKLFLGRYLAQQIKKSTWIPKILSSREFFESVSGLRTGEDYLMIGLLHQALPDEIEEKHNPQLFLNWAQTLLQDFKEIDQQLADPEKLFRDLFDIRSIETWTPDERKASASQLKYLDFCKHLPGIYLNFKNLMQENGLGHAGMVERRAHEKIEFFPIREEEQFVIAGFNALTRAEKEVFKFLKDRYSAEMIFDYDRFYTEEPVHEAGFFARENIQFLKQNPLQWTNNNFADIPKEVTVYRCAHGVEQTYVLNHLLQQSLNSVSHENTAIVLTDESLLIPVLKQLPEHIRDINVTMGFSLKFSPFFGLLDSIIRLYLNQEQQKKSGFYHHDVRRLLRNSVFHELLSPSMLKKRDDLMNRIDKLNLLYVSASELNGLIEEKKWNTTSLFPKKAESKNLIGLLTSFIETLDKQYQTDEHISGKIQREFLFHHHEVVSQIKEVEKQLKGEFDLMSLHKIWKQYTQISKVQFTGEPLSGLQVMGLLETRNLDFEQVFILNMNEGNLPSARVYNSIIPHDLKKQNGLLVHNEREAVFAYHFYRLIQRSSKIGLMYQVRGNDLRTGEKSRFILQLENELTRSSTEHRFTEIEVEPDHKELADQEKVIFKSEFAQARIFEKFENGISPTAISTFLNCPLDFYYKYVVGLRENQELSESVEANILGDILHQTLEHLYCDKIGKKLTKEDVKKMKLASRQVLQREFEKHFEARYIFTGKNLLAFNIASKYLEHFFEKENHRLSKDEIHLYALEYELSAMLHTEFGPVNIKGKLDRVEQSSGLTRIIDYKSGLVTPAELKSKSMQDVFTGNKNKFLQLMIYSWLTHKQGVFNQEISSVVYSMRSYHQGFIPLVFNESHRLNSEVFQIFENELVNILREIIDPETRFEHNPKSAYCEFC